MAEPVMRHRPVTAGDVGLLEVAVLGNVNWNAPRFTIDHVRARPELSHYARLDAVRGDFGVVAELDGRPVGVTWALFLPRDDPGYGYLAEDVPELSLWVHPDHRGHGIGRRLLRLVLDEAGRRQVPAVSLSVEEGNRAKHLYAREGFTEVAGREEGGVMVWSPPPPA